MSALTQSQESALNDFVALTAADKEVATQFLKACSWSTNIAVSRYFDYGGDVKKLAPKPKPQPQPQAQQPNLFSGLASALANTFAPYQNPQRQMVPNQNNNGFVDIQNQQIPNQFGQQPIRQADNYYTEQMVAGPYNQYGSSYYKQKKDNMSNFSKEWSKGKKTKKSDQLAKLFQDPDYKFRGDWELAKKNGQNKKLWILCNVQATSNFVSHCLNRDVFNDKELSPIIKSNFIFYQWANNTDKAKKLMSLYQKYKVPALFVVDPNTGLDSWTFDVPDAPDKVIIIKSKLLDFIDKYPDPSKKPKQQPIVEKKSDKPDNEDDELQKAIAASLEDNNVNFSDEEENNDDDWGDDDIDDNEINNDTNNNNNNEKDDDGDEEMNEIEPKKEEIKVIKYVLSDEPDKTDKDSTGIRLRLPGKMCTRRFKKSTKVGELYQWVIESMENPSEFSLMQQMPRLKLDDKEKTLEELKLFNTTINYHEL